MRVILVLALFVSSAAQAAEGVGGSPAATMHGALSGYQMDAAYHNGLASLRSQQFRQEQLDGGTLSPEHVALFQKRLDRLNDLHRRVVADNRRW